MTQAMDWRTRINGSDRRSLRETLDWMWAGGVLSGDVASEDALDDRFMEIADMISGFIFNSVYTRRAAERIIGDFQGAGSRALG